MRTVIGDWEPYVTRLHLLERVLSTCVDREQAIPVDALDNLVEEAGRREQRLLLAQALRARGVQRGAVPDLEAALTMFRGFGARPMVARVEAELGRVTGNEALETAGVAGLEALGDVTQLGRVAAATR
ncbi:MAG: hypothetical protein ACREKB_14650 [Candidatus Rokuibacteriota bacterium]